MKKFLDPSVCSCFLASYPYNICHKIKWSTLSICAAILIIVNSSHLISIFSFVFRLFRLFILVVDCMHWSM